MSDEKPDEGGIVVIARDEFMAEGVERFGKDPLQWKFKCTRCGGIQCGQDFIDAGVSEDDTRGMMSFSCIGRIVPGRGCDWTLGGFFQIHKIVILHEGQEYPTFDFATEEEINERNQERPRNEEVPELS